jgi:hypothetical protein
MDNHEYKKIHALPGDLVVVHVFVMGILSARSAPSIANRAAPTPGADVFEGEPAGSSATRIPRHGGPRSRCPRESRSIVVFKNNYVEAVPPLRAAVKLRPTLSKTQALLGMAEKRTGDHKNAQADLAAAFPNLKEGQD